MTQVIVDYPPNFEVIDAAFHVKGKTVIFSWGDRIYNPTGSHIEPKLIAHEAVHGIRQKRYVGSSRSGAQEVVEDQQKSNIERWWERYIEDREFRLTEEIVAHWVEYRWILSNGVSRRQKRAALARTALRLAAPLYGSMVTVFEARKFLEREDVGQW